LGKERDKARGKGTGGEGKDGVEGRGEGKGSITTAVN